ncbi:MAG: hypothetical protein EON90_10815 [Brevundimonas sp.]|nr:MAG: hypothetical protein EON90_10815 [Brevundimonas sp.]
MPALHSRFAIANALHQLAEANGVTHFGTLKIGLLGRSSIDVHRELLRPLAVVVRAYARYRSDVCKRAMLRADHLPFIVGVAERFDRAGSVDPHLHYFVRLEHDEEPFYRGFLRSRFGRDDTDQAGLLPAFTHPPGTQARMREFLIPTEVSSTARPPRPLIKRRDAAPTFDLQPLSTDWRRATNYVVKQSLSPEIITHLDLLEI